MYVSATHEQVRDMARQFAEDVIRPQAEALDREERFPAELYLQMVDGLTPSIAGLFMVPMMTGIGTTSFASGYLMSRTGRYACRTSSSFAFLSTPRTS